MPSPSRACQGDRLAASTASGCSSGSAGRAGNSAGGPAQIGLRTCSGAQVGNKN